MKKIFNRSLATALLLLTAVCTLPATVYAQAESKAIVLFTNDVHCAIDDYDELAAYRSELIQEGYDVVTVDAGDAIQGEVIGSLSKGSAIVDIMNTVGYDYAVPGNHEFDYGADVLFDLADEQAEYEYLSANFVDLRTDATVFKPYSIVELNGEEVAFLGIVTPESYTKSTPAYFQDEDGNIIYGFCQNDFYQTIQSSVDAAVEDGADRVVAIGHLGTTGITEGWSSTDVIANTTGIDAFIDAHSHEVIEEDLCKNKNGEDVVLSSTGTKFEYFGQLTLLSDGTEEAQLISPESINVDTLSDSAKAAYQEVNEKINGYNGEIEYLYEELGTAEVELTLNDPATDEWVIRKAETNMGNFVADAYRVRTGADISLVNSGGIRASVSEGTVTRKALMDVNPWNNQMCVINATGQQILDALEHSARLYPETCGGFLQVSGLTYEIHAWNDSPVITDDMGAFSGIDTTKESRIANVKIGSELIDPKKTYTVAGSYYMLKQGGDGFTMFADCDVVKADGLATDAEMLISYFVENLNGNISKEQYGNPYGDGRISIYAEADDVPAVENTETTAVEELPSSQSDKSPMTGDYSRVVIISVAFVVGIGALLVGVISSVRKKKI